MADIKLYQVLDGCGLIPMSKVFEIIEKEKQRQLNTLGMIPSENLASKAVLDACGSVLNNKYAEGYPLKRYYQGQEFVDQVELMAIALAKKLFNAEHANVQPNSGSPANMAAYDALLEPNDKIISMSLAQGGHLTHGSSVNFSGKKYNFVHYSLNPETELIDMDVVAEMADNEKPQMILSGYTAYPRSIDFQQFHKIAESVGAYSIADISHIAGLIVGDAHPSPLPFTDVVTTTTHKTLRGPRSAIILSKEKFAKQIDKAVFPGLQGGPHEHTIAAKAICFEEALAPGFKDYAAQIVKNAHTLAKVMMDNGLKLVSNGTDNHLILIDLRTLGLEAKGRAAAVALEDAGIVTNANTIPYETGSPFNPSGIRLGTPLLTTRGMKEEEMEKIGHWFVEVLKNHDSSETKEKVKEQVLALCKEFPFY